MFIYLVAYKMFHKNRAQLKKPTGLMLVASLPTGQPMTLMLALRFDLVTEGTEDPVELSL